MSGGPGPRRNVLFSMSDFPITPLLPEVLASLARQPRLVLEAPPGAGKTTQVPPALLAAPWLGGRRIVMLEPRRVAARAAAQFMAAQRGEDVGVTVGYRIRFESRVSAATRIEVVTEGILTRMIQRDPELTGIGALVFDEFHERHLAGDLGVALALDVQSTLRPDLRLLIMSATLDGERVAAWLDAPRLTSPGRSFPVRIIHAPLRAPETDAAQLVRVLRDALATTTGDVLVFLPGKREIARAQAALRSALAEESPAVEVIALHGGLTQAAQQAALAPATAGTRRVVLATNVAESSVTLPGICAVVDAGTAREPCFDPNSGFTRLETVAISQASADQRAGRAGRVAPGVAYRLWPQGRHLEPSRHAEIAQVELSALALELAAWGIVAGGQSDLDWLDPPPAGALAQARDLLCLLGALDEAGRITPQGRRMLALGTTPRLAAAALHAPRDCRALAADLLALAEVRSPLRGAQARSDDFCARLAALEAWRARRHQAERDVDRGALAAIADAARRWRGRLDAESTLAGSTAAAAADATFAPETASGISVGNLLLHAFPDRIARRDEGQRLRYTLANGRGAYLREDTALAGEAWLVALELRLEAGDSQILAAAPFDPGLLEREFPQAFAERRCLRWNDARGAAEAFIERRFASIVLERASVPVAAADALPALLAAIRGKGLGVLPWDAGTLRLRARMEALRAWLPDAGLPDVSDAALLGTLEDWLAPFLAGRHRLAALGAEDLAQALLAMLDHDARKLLDAQAPDSLVVPSGQRRRLDYASAAAPVLAVKLQELFGLADTPRVGGGRIPVTLHLLSPAGRPIQVTQDLRGFWERTYPEVRRELKGRYPRHPWPADPWSAAPTHRAKPRGT